MEDKYCRFCGAELHEEALFCSKCGKRVAPVDDTNRQSIRPNQTVTKESLRTEPDKGSLSGKVKSVALESPYDSTESDSRDESQDGSQNSKVAKNRRRIAMIVAFVAIVGILGAIGIVGYGKTRWFDGTGKPINLRVWNGADFDYDEWKNNAPELGKITDQCVRYMQPAQEGKAAQNYLNDSSDGHIVMTAWSSSKGRDNALLIGFGNDANNMGSVFNCISKAVGYPKDDLQYVLENTAAGGDGSLVVPYTLKQASSVQLTQTMIASCLPSTEGQSAYTYCMIGQNHFSGSHQESDDVDDSEPTTQSDSSTSSSNQNAESDDSSVADDDFADLWTAVAIKENLSKIAGEYCRNDGSCVMIKANSGHTAGDYSTKPGEIIFTSSGRTFNPLPGQSTELGLSFAFQQQPTTVPDTITPIDMQTMTDGCNAASDASCQAGVTYVMPGAGTSHFTDRVESGNSPDSNKSYLVIGWQTKVSDDTVFYRK
ncbi:hypothetical protein GFD17_06780 [Bifidobacterium sp. SMB2]|uniref:Zinc-ribbon domain-containing protein n=1 Tax=Bifidobacterium saimiriisciurei TaxID=2661627 RepID=A0ABX0CED4_9BIFI|nr:MULTISPECIES: zinc ribbon domain-containing protein [Bifidobacterium]NEG96458.1 hypothetical protein [Bifidobacterium sp. SMB2]NEH12546.1 hypothetical protein [Bifidobacterium saimiriisciurei]